jgi:protein transport protein SEC31
MDGFVSSAGTATNTAAMLGAKYGNSNAGFAQEAAVQEQAAPSGDTSRVSPENMPIVEAFQSLNAQLEQVCQGGGEKRQLKEIKAACTLLFDKLNASALHPEVCASLIQMTQLLRQGDFKTALAVHVGLTTTDWAEHKDWLRGLKFLIQLATKKFQR